MPCICGEKTYVLESPFKSVTLDEQKKQSLKKRQCSTLYITISHGGDEHYTNDHKYGPP